MKCIHCGRNPWRGPRDGPRPACNHRFADRDRDDPYGLTDEDFHAGVQDASTGGSHSFTARQPWYSLARPGGRRRTLWERFVPRLPWVGGAAAVALGILNIVELNPFALYVAGFSLDRVVVAQHAEIAAFG